MLAKKEERVRGNLVPLAAVFNISIATGGVDEAANCVTSPKRVSLNVFILACERGSGGP